MGRELTAVSPLAWPYLLLLVVALILPSDGDHGLLSPKSLAFILAVGFAAITLVTKRYLASSQIKLFAFFLFSLAFLLFWILISSSHRQVDWAGQSDQAKLFLITLTVPLLALFFLKEKLLSVSAIFRTIFFANFFYCLAKLLLVVASSLGFISIWDAMNLMGIRFMQMGIYGGLERVQTSVDIVTPFIVFFVLQAERLKIKLPRGFITAYLIVTCLANFLSFSRFLLFVYFCSIILFVCSLPLQRFIKSVFILFFVLSLSISYIGLEPITSVIEKRIYSSDNYLSDEVRRNQIELLWREHEKNPWMGKGLGGYVPNFVRDYQLPHSYEVQWAAFLMQFGVIGIFLLTVPLFLISCTFFPLTHLSFSFLLLFFLWILSGFTNPFLISLTSGVVYTLFYLGGRGIKETILIETKICTH